MILYGCRAGVQCDCNIWQSFVALYPTITYYWTVPLILVGNLTNSKIAETKALDLLNP